MTNAPLPWFIVPLCAATGILLIAAGIPLYLRRVPPNALYGARFPSTLHDESVWYEINARAGRDLIVIGALYLVLLGLALRVGQSWPLEIRLLGPLAVLVIGLMIDTIALGLAAHRLSAERRASREPTQ